MLGQLLDQKSGEVDVTEAVIDAAATNYSSRKTGGKILALLLDRCREKIEITEKIQDAIERYKRQVAR